ncbi:MAG: YqgE/AlgH family protein [Coxiellaceae bacterium]|nr:YqgE/AlgH family protein [Coxiellaceae bacterium]
MQITENLTHHFLIAMPTLEDTFFSKSVVYIYEHSAEGALGVVINKSLQITLENLLQHLEIEISEKSIVDLPVLSGGPVSPEQGFVLHDRLEAADTDVAITSSKEMLVDIAEGRGPKHYIVVLGYSGWDAGQLEEEINRNDWLITPFDPTLLFETPMEKRWQEAAKLIGIDINRLSGHTGRA